jgi:hypothetical protein
MIVYRISLAIRPENPTDKQKEAEEQAGRKVLVTRELFPGCSLADLYGPIAMPPTHISLRIFQISWAQKFLITFHILLINIKPFTSCLLPNNTGSSHFLLLQVLIAPPYHLPNTTIHPCYISREE